MLTLYMTCLIGGGIFVALSAFSGLNEDVGFDADQGELSEFDLADVASAAEHDLDISGQASLADAGHGLEGAKGREKKPLWLPFTSFRFWTFGTAFFGLTGVSLSMLSLSVEPLVFALSMGVGLVVGSASALIVQRLQRPIGQARVSASDFAGATGELLFNLRGGGVSKVRLEGLGGVHELIAIADEGVELPKGCRVVVLGLDKEGRARVSSEDEIFALEEK